jgi:hypothetical protein
MESPLEHILTHSYKAGMIDWMQQNPESFGELVSLASADKQPYSWRASWLLWSVMEENDSRVRGEVEKMISVLPYRNDSQQRELMMILDKMEISEELEGILFNHCVGLWEQTRKKTAIRSRAFAIMMKIGRKYPELMHEIGFLAEEKYLDTLSVAARKGIGRILQEVSLPYRGKAR